MWHVAISIARTLRYAIDQITVEHRQAADHFRRSLRTGTYCSYVPDSLATVAWDL